MIRRKRRRREETSCGNRAHNERDEVIDPNLFVVDEMPEAKINENANKVMLKSL
jgi:hypothetical protein